MQKNNSFLAKCILYFILCLLCKSNLLSQRQVDRALLTQCLQEELNAKNGQSLKAENYISAILENFPKFDKSLNQAQSWAFVYKGKKYSDIALRSIWDNAAINKGIIIDEYSILVNSNVMKITTTDFLNAMADDMDSYLGNSLLDQNFRDKMSYRGDFKRIGHGKQPPRVNEVIEIDLKRAFFEAQSKLLGIAIPFVENPHNAPVIITDITTNSFTVQTIKLNNANSWWDPVGKIFNSGVHPLHGYRTWGFEIVSPNTVRFYARGVSIPDGWDSNWYAATKAAEKDMWTSWVRDMKKKVGEINVYSDRITQVETASLNSILACINAKKSQNTVPVGTNLVNGTYTIRLANGKALDANAAQVNNDGGQVAIWDYVAGSPEQQWILTNVGGGKYTIKVKASNKALDLNGSNSNNGGAITLWALHGGANQQWIISQASNGLFKIHTSLPPYRVIDVYTGNISTNGTKISLYDLGNNQPNQLWKIEAVATPQPPTNKVYIGKLAMGQQLNPGDILKSSNGAHQLVYQTDGNLVIYRNGAAVWHSHTYGQPAGFCAMQEDGNLVIYKPSGAAIWATSTHTCQANFLAMQDDGNLVLYTVAGKPVWNTVTQNGLTNMNSVTGQKLCK